MRFEVVDRISIPSPTSAVNEDAVGATNTAAWVIDGATGVSDLPPLVLGLTDAAWLTMQLNDRLHAAFEGAVVEPCAALAKIDADVRRPTNINRSRALKLSLFGAERCRTMI